MKKRLLFLLLCGSIFYAEASTLEPAYTKRAVDIPSWNSVYDLENLEDQRAPRVKVPKSDTSIEDFYHRLMPLKADEYHEVGYTYHKDEYAREAPRNQLGKYYEKLTFEQMKAEHEVLNIAAFIGLEADELLQQYDMNFVFFKNIKWREKESTFRGLEPRWQVEQCKELLALWKILKKFERVVGPPEFKWPFNLEIYKFQSLLVEEVKFIRRLLGIYRCVVTDELIQKVEQEMYEQEMTKQPAKKTAKQPAEQSTEQQQKRRRIEKEH